MTVHCRNPDPADIDRVIASATDSQRLAWLVQQCNLYPGDAKAEQRLREHLTIKPVAGGPWGTNIGIEFKYPNEETAQRVAMLVAWSIVHDGAGRPSGMTLVMSAPSYVHRHNGHFPNVMKGSGAGLVLGFACAALLGSWRTIAARRQPRHA